MKAPSFPSWSLAAALIVLAALARLVPGLPPNFSPVGAMGLYAGASLGLPAAALLSLAALALSDLVLGFYSPVSMVFVYLGMLAGVGAGHLFLQCPLSLTRMLGTATLGAVFFFLLSNFGVWLEGLLYPHTFEGLLACFIAALPFFGMTLAGNLLFTLALFGLDAGFTGRLAALPLRTH